MPQSKAKRARFRGTAIVVVAILVSACSKNWGDQIENFVNNEAHGFTYRIAEQELRVRWFDYFSSLTSKSILVLDMVNKLNERAMIGPPDVASFSSREDTLVELDEAQLLTMESMRVSRAALIELERAPAICESPGPMHELDRQALGLRIATQLVVPKPQWGAGILCQVSNGDGDNQSDSKSTKPDCWGSIVSTSVSLFGYSKEKEQEDKANRAIASIPEKVVSADEISALSRAACISARDNAHLTQGLATARGALAAGVRTSKRLAAALRQAQNDVEAKQTPTLLQKVQDQHGLTRLASEVARDYAQAYVAEVLDFQRKELRDLETHYNEAQSCSDLLMSAFIMEAALTEKRLQVDAASRVGGVHEETLAAFATDLTEAGAGLRSHADARKQTLCAP